MAKKGSTVKGEKKDKAEKFVEVANKRVPKALKAIKLLGNLGGSAYANTEAQRSAICSALRSAVDQVEKKLAGSKEAEPEFKL